MKIILFVTVAISLAFGGCKHSLTHFPEQDFVDRESSTLSAKNISDELYKDSIFWTSRLSSDPINYTAASKLSAVLQQKFQASGNINHLNAANALIDTLLTVYGTHHAGLLRTQSAIAITKHQFKQADMAIQKAIEVGEEKRESLLMSFDTQFELGYYTMAARTLQSCKKTNDYGYFFRMFKWKHYVGETDSAIWYLKKAQEWAGSNKTLLSVARVNEADLYLHEGKLKEAIAAYKKNIEQNTNDFHSWMGMAKCMIQYSNGYTNALKLLTKISQNNQLPDPYYSMLAAAEGLQNHNLQYTYATQFAKKASDTLYGSMYTKYLIDLYTGILQQPTKALALAQAEINNRATPQTYAWLTWALHQNKQYNSADSVYTSYVKGKPLEALELFWMGVRMNDLHKKNNAKLFFEAAAQNFHDLSPSKQVQLTELLQ